MSDHPSNLHHTQNVIPNQLSMYPPNNAMTPNNSQHPVAMEAHSIPANLMVPMQNSSPAKGSPGASDYVEVLPKSRLADLVREIDVNLHLEDDVEEFLLKYVDDFIDRVINGACTIAKHRQDSTVEVKDVQQYLTRNYDIWIPGFGTDELKPYKRNPTMESHKQRLALIRRALKKY